MRKEIAVVGCGYWGKNLVRNFYELNSLLAIYDNDRSKTDSLRQKYPGLLAYDSWDGMLNDPRIGAVVISTPSSTHYSLTKQALLANKDVMVEKPMALHCHEGEELVSLAQEKNKILMVGHLLVYHPAIIKLKEMIDKGEIGKIDYIYSNRLNLGKFRAEENILWSFAPHDISVILFLLDEMPDSVSAHGGSFLHADIADVTVTSLNFPHGVRSHIFVSWLHPYKEQKLVIIGNKKMVLFDDVNPREKLVVYEHKIDWIVGLPVPRPELAKPVETEEREPLKVECEHFIRSIQMRTPPLTDGNEGLRVLSILEACQKSLEQKGKAVGITGDKERKFFLHGTSQVDEPCEIGEGSKIWHFSHILKNCQIGQNCTIGQNVSIGPNVRIGNNVKIQNNVSIYEGVTLEDDVFCGPSMVFTNVIIPRSHWPRKDEFKKTLVRRGASLGANSTIICGITVGPYAFVGAGALVNKDVPDYGLVYGNPARLQGWMCYCAVKLNLTNSIDTQETAECSNCGRKYSKKGLVVSEISK
jgi:UDP-2-acetamido-3-amino-2,3-dideoxy-glucuronate N-acetyltransferase